MRFMDKDKKTLLEEIKTANLNDAHNIDVRKPFSSGSGAMAWRGVNCEKCNRSACTRAGKILEIETANQMALDGTECMGAIAIDYGFVGGVIPTAIYDWIWPNRDKTDRCAHFEKYKPESDAFDDPTTEEPTPPNQMSLF